MRRNMAHTITKGEWFDIMELAKVKKMFGLGAFINLDDFAGRVYGAKFKCTMHMSEEDGFIYVLVGNVANGEVLMLERVEGAIKPLK